MSTQIQLTENKQIQEVKPSYQEVEKALIKVLKAGILSGRPKDGKFMQNYKKRVLELRQTEDPEVYILENARRLFPTEDKYKQVMSDYKSYYDKDLKILNAVMELYELYYRLAKDYFITEEQADKSLEDFLNL